MRKLSTSSRKPSSRKPATVADVATVAAPAVEAPANVEAPADVPAPADVAAPANVADLSAAPADVANVEPAAPSADVATYRGATRDANGIVAQRTNFDQYSNRDDAYLAFFGSVARTVGADVFTLKNIFDAGAKRDKKSYNPFYTGSSKATDVGAINRLIKAGHLTQSADGSTLTATEKALKSSAYAKQRNATA